MEDGTGLDINAPEEILFRKLVGNVIIAESNDAMARMYGFDKAKELTGVKIKDLLVNSSQNLENFTAFIRNGFKLIDFETVEKDKSGNIKYFLNNLIGVIEKGKLVRAWGTQKDITDLKKASDALMKLNEQLTQKNSELVKINNELDSFIYTVSHDLNSPLSNIEGLINVLKLNDCYLKEDAKALIDYMEVAILKFKGTIKNIAEIPKSHLKSKSEKVEPKFEEILDHVKFSIHNLIEDTDAEIIAEFQEQSISITATGLQSVLYNLLNNSLKYRHPDRQPLIKVKSSFQDEYVILEVQDNGIGFDPENCNDVFELFKRCHDHVEGSGLGLYIVKRIAENSGGKVEVVTTPGKGSIFKVYFRKN
jgi:signal transduction histidine kinase